MAATDTDGAVAPDMAVRRCTGKSAMMSAMMMRPLQVGSDKRNFLQYVPSGYDPTRPTMLVVALHGITSMDTDFVNSIKLIPAAEQRNFLMVAPQAMGLARAWNAGGCCPEASTLNYKDVAFIQALVAQSKDEFCIDDSRVYVTGFSNGGFMSNRLACEMSDTFAAFGPVSAGLAIAANTCTPKNPMPMLYFHGKADAVVQYGGNTLEGFIGAEKTFQAWAMYDGCTDPMPMQTLSKGAVTCQTYSQCAQGAEVTLCTIAGGDHSWPGAANGNMDVDATTMILDFFAKHPRK